MNKGAIILIGIGGVIIFFPEIIAYALGGLLISFGILFLLATRGFGKNPQNTKETNYFKFGDYKIYKNNK